MRNVELGLLVVTDQESRNQPRPLANIRQSRRPFCTIRPILQPPSNTNRRTARRVLLSGGPNQFTLCSLCSPHSCATLEFFSLTAMTVFSVFPVLVGRFIVTRKFVVGCFGLSASEIIFCPSDPVWRRKPLCGHVFTSTRVNLQARWPRCKSTP
jgi:hypothetical protein